MCTLPARHKMMKQLFDKRESGEDRQSHVAATFTAQTHVFSAAHLNVKVGRLVQKGLNYYRTRPKVSQETLLLLIK